MSEGRAAWTDSARAFDPATFSVLLSRFNTIADEMTVTMEKTSYSSLLALGHDYSCAIYDAVPRQICMFDAIPIHTNSIHLVLKEIARTFDGDIREGDCFFCNDPFRFNTHLGDLVTACPVFADGRHLFWAVTKGHQQDVGAFIPSSMAALARNVWQDGFRIPPTKLVDAGRERADIVDLYLSNVRYPEMLEGDLRAQLASIGRGRMRLQELVDDYGRDEVLMYIERILDYADRRMSQEIQSMPDGEYEGMSWVDGDGVGGQNIPIRVKVTVAGTEVKADFTGSGPQSPTGINGTFATLQAAAALPFLCYVDSDIPKNDGCLRHIEAIAPEGSICNARYPAATGLATSTPPNAMYDAINKAMVSAIPERVFAGGPRCNNYPEFSGVDPRTGRAWAAMVFNSGGGQGATRGTDGWPVCGSQSGMGGLKALSIEQFEILYPLIVEHWEIEPESMGYGTSIGGPGNRMVIRSIEGRFDCAAIADGFSNPPHGILGGTPGIGGGQYVEDDATGARRFFSPVGNFRIEEGERWVGVSTGGGGYGSPLERDPEVVRRGVRDGLFSRQTALDAFGVSVTDDWDPLLEVAETRRLRDLQAELPRPLSEPSVPGAATWLAETMRDGDEYILNPVDTR